MPPSAVGFFNILPMPMPAAGPLPIEAGPGGPGARKKAPAAGAAQKPPKRAPAPRPNVEPATFNTGGAAKARGAPPRDLLTISQSKVEHWATMTADDDLLVKEPAKSLRNLKRFYTDINERMATFKAGSPEWTEYKVAGKCTHAMHTIFSAWVRGGGYSVQVVSAMDEMDHFLEMGPCTVKAPYFRHPPFLLKQRHEVKCIRADGGSFWQYLTDAVLQGVGFEAAELGAKQADFIAQKTVQHHSQVGT